VDLEIKSEASYDAQPQNAQIREDISE